MDSPAPAPPRIAFDALGQGPAVLFLHGIGGNRANWAPQLTALSGYRRVAIDFRGYGGSGDADDTLDFHDFTADATGTLDRLGIARCHVVGLSMGGLVAQALYARHPARVRSLLLAGTRPGSAPVFDAGAGFTAQRLGPLESGGLAALADSLLPRLLGEDVSAEARDAIRNSLLWLRPASYRRTMAARQRVAPFLDPAAIAVPTLVVAGGADRVAPLEQMAALAAAIPEARLEALHGAGHLCNIEQPARFTALLRGFLATLGDDP